MRLATPGSRTDRYENLLLSSGKAFNGLRSEAGGVPGQIIFKKNHYFKPFPSNRFSILCIDNLHFIMKTFKINLAEKDMPLSLPSAFEKRQQLLKKSYKKIKRI